MIIYEKPVASYFENVVSELEAWAGDTKELDWDGRDAAGRRVGSGVFLYKLEAAEVSRVQKMVLLK